jgi:O-antigen/teichoic acid export membrane protein
VQQIEILWRKWVESPTARNISKVYVGDVVSKILSAGVMLILIRGMTKLDYASYVAFTSIAVLSASLIGNGINNALVRFSAEHISRTGEKPFSLYLLSLGFELTIFLIVLLFMLVFPKQIATLFLGKPDFANIIPIGALFGLGRLLLAIGMSILQTEERFNQYIWSLWLKNGLTLLVVVALWFSQSLNFRLVAWGLTIIQLLVGGGIAISGIAGILTTTWKKRIERERYLVTDFLYASGWLIAYFVVLAAFSRLDVVMLSRYSSEVELANYGVAFNYYSMALLLLGSIHAVLRPKFSRIEMQNGDKQTRFLSTWLHNSIWVGVPAMLFIFFGKPIFLFINGIQYERSFTILCVLTIGFWLSLMFSPLVNILMSRKNFRFLFILAVIAFVINLTANYVGVRIGGGVGAAIAVVLSHNIVLQVPVLLRVMK